MPAAPGSSASSGSASAAGSRLDGASTELPGSRIDPDSRGTAGARGGTIPRLRRRARARRRTRGDGAFRSDGRLILLLAHGLLAALLGSCGTPRWEVTPLWQEPADREPESGEDPAARDDLEPGATGPSESSRARVVAESGDEVSPDEAAPDGAELRSGGLLIIDGFVVSPTTDDDESAGADSADDERGRYAQLRQPIPYYGRADVAVVPGPVPPSDNPSAPPLPYATVRAGVGIPPPVTRWIFPFDFFIEMASLPFGPSDDVVSRAALQPSRRVDAVPAGPDAVGDESQLRARARAAVRAR